MIKAIIFDKDGVIVDSEPIQYEAFRQVIAEYGHTYTIEDNKILSIGKGHSAYFDIAKKYQITDVELFIKRRRERYIKLAKEKLLLRKGVRSVLEKIKKKGYPLAVASGASYYSIEHDLQKFNLQHYFSAIVTGETYRSKPSPDIFLAAAKKLRKQPKHCLVFEDSQAGVEGAKAAGMYCIAVPHKWTNHQDFSKADKIIDSFEKINRIVYSLLDNANKN